MYDDDNLEVSVPHPRSGGQTSSGPTAYYPARFPTKNISTPIVLFYGDIDSLVDINLMLKELPANSIAIPLEVSFYVASNCGYDEQFPAGLRAPRCDLGEERRQGRHP